MRKRNRILAAALGLVATIGAFGTFGALETFENCALFGDETTSSRPLVVKTKEGELLSKPSARKVFLVAADDYGDAATALAARRTTSKRWRPGSSKSVSTRTTSSS